MLPSVLQLLGAIAIALGVGGLALAAAGVLVGISVTVLVVGLETLIGGVALERAALVELAETAEPG